MANYYISDTHFGHANIIKHCNRKFKSVDEMDEKIIENWNRVVTDSDDVWILGDFSFRSADNPIRYLQVLNGKKHLIIGNHDGALLADPECRKTFVSIDQLKTIRDGNTKITLCHYPLVEWDGLYRGALHFYGHIHNNTKIQAYNIMKQVANAYNVGADILDFTPRKLKDVVRYNDIYREQ